jgi:hypothetical protein
MRNILTILRWVIALILCSWGLFMVVGFAKQMWDGDSEQSLWFDLFFVTIVGLVPLGGGLMLIFMRRLRSPHSEKTDEHTTA